MKRSRRCYVSIPGYDRNENGTRKVWRTHAEPTYCCEGRPSYYVFERNTRFNDYNGYGGYFHVSDVELV